MSTSFYTYRELADRPEFFSGPNLSNRNAGLVLRSLGYDPERDDERGVCGPFEPRELKGRLLLALAVGGAVPDHGTATIESGGLVECGLPAGLLPARLRADSARLRAGRALGQLGARRLSPARGLVRPSIAP